MSIFGDIEQFIAEDLYPYRVPITIIVGVALAGALVLVYRAGLHLLAWRHKVITGALVAVFLAVTIPAGDYFLSPLWERSFLEEESPLAVAAEGTPTPVASPEPSPTPPSDQGAPEPDQPTPPAQDPEFEPRVTHEGEFVGADDFHFGRGKALIIETEPGVYTLRFEDFSVRNGPDLFVYLSPSPEGYADGFVDLGRLKATDGAFNYEIPPGTDVSQFKSAIVWCKQFAVLFAVASLETA